VGFGSGSNQGSDAPKTWRIKTHQGYSANFREVLNYLDNCHVTRYNHCMIKTFADRETQQVYVTGKSKRLPPDVAKRALRRLEYIDLANSLGDLQVPPSNRLHALEGDRVGQYSISINMQWRICFRFVAGDAYDVEITDYH
jgi:proteic killer suppression protein